MLSLEDIRLVYNPGTVTEVAALRGVTLQVPKGQFVTVVGSNGAGKSSLMQIVSGAVRPASGRVRIDDRDVTRQPDYRRAQFVARVFDNPHAGTAPDLSIEENVALAMSRGAKRGLRFAVTARRRRVMRERLAVLGLGLEDRLTDRVALLSAGQRQSLTMVMAAMTQPEVLLLDEHLAALDPGTQARVLDLTIELARELACTTLMITHNMDHAIAVGDRLVVMSHGRAIADFAGDEKRNLTPQTLVEHITGAGDALTDRMMLGALETGDTR